MKITGDWATRRVTVDGRTLSPKRSQKIWNHSPDGFAWGYGGSGPAQLALAVLIKAGLKPSRAVQLHQEFKRDWIAVLPQRDFEIELDVMLWVQDHAHVFRETV